MKCNLHDENENHGWILDSNKQFHTTFSELTCRCAAQRFHTSVKMLRIYGFHVVIRCWVKVKVARCVMCDVYDGKARDIHAMSLFARRDEARRGELNTASRVCCATNDQTPDSRFQRDVMLCHGSNQYQHDQHNSPSSIISPLPLACAPFFVALEYRWKKARIVIRSKQASLEVIIIFKGPNTPIIHHPLSNHRFR
jgi:hypothetical protein